MVDDGLGASGLDGTAVAAAAAAGKATPRYPSKLTRDPVLHLLRRATFGPTAADVTAVTGLGLDAWIEQQLNPSAIADPVADSVLTAFPLVAMTTAQVRAAVKQYGWDAMYQLGWATMARQLWTKRQLFEVMADFWSNHFNVACPFANVWDTRVGYDRDVIRANALGRFSDLLLAVGRSPAMLRYLNNDVSNKKAINENYGRELLELHTVGVEAGYTETDVRASAAIMTGRSVTKTGEFVYQPAMHVTGAASVLGFSDANATADGGLAVGDAYLTYLAKHPSTAAHLARKLAVRFVCDSPPQSLVDRLASAYLANGTAIAPVLRTLFRSREFWISNGLKTRRPLENIVATARVLGVTPAATGAGSAVQNLYWLAHNAGQAPLGWEPPNGYPDVAAAWTSSNSVLAAWNGHRALVHGWYAGLTYPAPDKLLAAPPATVGPYLDALATRLLFQPLSAAERAALLTFLGATATTTNAKANMTVAAANVVPLFLDSLAHGVR